MIGWFGRKNRVLIHFPELQQKFWMTIDRESLWDGTLVDGDCSANPLVGPPELCRFAHPWVPDDVPLDTIPLVFGAATWPFVRNVLVKAAQTFWLHGLLALMVAVALARLLRGSKVKRE